VDSEPSLAFTGRLVSLPLALTLALGIVSLLCADAGAGASTAASRPASAARIMM
jgi:hypothetical protein